MSERTPELADIIVGAIEDRLADVHTMLPGRITKYDRDTQKAEVEPLLRGVQKTIDGELNEKLPNIPGVPVVFPRAGGFKITFPVEVGNRCTLVFCERSIDAYQVGQGGVTDPGLFQMHDLSDPVAILGWYPDQDAADPTDETNMVLGKDGGGATIHIGDDEITMYKAEGSSPFIKISNDQVDLYADSGAGHDFVALAQKVLTELQTAQQNVQSLATYVSNAILAFTLFIAVPQDGGTALQTQWGIWLGTNPPPTPTAPQSVAADKVKAT